MDKYIKDVANGAIFEEDVENFHLVELGFDANGERTAKGLTTGATKAFLVASKEVRYLNEPLYAFYNQAGERGRIIFLTEGLQIDVSAYDASGVAEIKAGQSAHYDVTTKKYIVHDGSHADFATALVQFTVLSSEDNLEYVAGLPTVRLEVQ